MLRLWGKQRIRERLDDIKRDAEVNSLRTQNAQLKDIVDHINQLGKKARETSCIQFSKDLYTHGCEVTIIVHPFPVTRRTTHAD